MHFNRYDCILFGLLLMTLSVIAVKEFEENNSSSKNTLRRRANKNSAHQQQQQQQHTQKQKQKQQHATNAQQANSSPAASLLLLDSDEFLNAEDYELLDTNTHTEHIDGGSDSAEEGREERTPKTLNPAYDIFTCCNEVFGSCRTSCENLSLVQLATTSDLSMTRGPRLELKKYCPSMQMEFWSCMNRTLDAVANGVQWSGRRCCALGLLPHCRNACATSGSLTELNSLQVCRRSDEQHMYGCFERQEQGDHCCGKARTSECLQACRDVFESTPNDSNASINTSSSQQLTNACGAQNSDVLQCINNATDMTPLANAHKYLPCCKYASKEHCRNTCRTLLRDSATNALSSEAVFSSLESAGCGTPLPHLPLWQCFLAATRKVHVPALADGKTEKHEHAAVSQLKQLGIDAAKLHCCEQATTLKCRRLCAQIFSNDWWESRELFESNCLEQPGELELRRCLVSVDEPCELGCDELTFCTNFNNRPTELFRSCTNATDVAARADLKLLEQRGFVRVLGVNLHIKNTTRCEPSKWKALVCALHLKPCTRAGLYNNVCREDCYQLLNECMDWSSMTHYQNMNADAICARLQPGGLATDAAANAGEEPPPCVSLRPYLSSSDTPQNPAGHHGLSAPCRTRPCNATTEICVASRNGSIGYSCVPACALGETSSFMVPLGAFVRVPAVGKSREVGTSSTADFLVCRCGSHGRMEHCQPLPSYTNEHCFLPGGRRIKHGDSFYLECNLCSCFAGEITCTKKQCRLPGYTDIAYTSLPCNCPAHYVPVCGANGNTYQSACIAKCFGLQDTEYEYGSCDMRNPCQSGKPVCADGLQCLVRRKICLSTMQRPCQQYVCFNQTDHCPVQLSKQPVCDTQTRTHTSACSLLSAKAELAYWNACQPPVAGCSGKGPVCGINGVTYVNECSAWSDFILVDYIGRCRDIGLLTTDMGPRCRTVKCPPSRSPYCQNIVPPGACCPICAGGAFRVIYSRKQLDRAMYALRGQHRDLLTLQGVLREIDALIQISECQLTGFVTMEVGLFVAVVPRHESPTRVQVEACNREAEKVSALISAQSPRITTNLALSGLTVSHMLDPKLYSASACIRPQVIVFILVLLSCFLFRSQILSL